MARDRRRYCVLRAAASAGDQLIEESTIKMEINLTNTDGKNVAIDSENIVSVNDEGPHRVVTYRVIYRLHVTEKAPAINKMMHGLTLDDDDK